MKYLPYLSAIALLTAGSTAWAGFPIPQLLSTDPAQPRANQSFELIYTLATCGDNFPGSTSENRTIELLGDTIRVTALYSGELCIPLQPYQPVYRWRIDSMPTGSYQLELWGYNNGPQNAFPIAAGEVTILPAPVALKPSVVPATGLVGLFSLAAVLVLAGICGWRRK